MTDVFSELKEELLKNNTIASHFYEKFDVKRGLRNRDGSGVLAGLSHISSVVGFHKIEGDIHPVEGDLKYRGVSISTLLPSLVKQRYVFEQVIFLLMVGRLPSDQELETLLAYFQSNQTLPQPVLDIIEQLPSQNIMNKLQTAVSALYAFDPEPDSLDPYENFLKSLRLLAKLPAILVYSYEAAFGQGNFYKSPKQLSVAETFLSLLRGTDQPNPADVAIFDLCLMLHAEHGGGNNSTFTTYVVSSSGSDLYSTLAAAIASLKGPLHGAANKKVMEMMADIRAHVSDWSNETELKDYVSCLIRKEAHDHSGKLYGLGHAVYTKSDPRAVIILEQARILAAAKKREKELTLYEDVASFGPQLFQEIKKSDKVISPNVDFFSGFVYDCLGIPTELYTPIFALARTAGWCSHRIEEMLSGKRIIRPGYKFVQS
ncbi:MAG: citrate synthase [bacterium]